MSNGNLTQGALKFNRPARINECGHPERKHCAHGLCYSCYSKWRDGKTGDGKRRMARYRRKHRERLLKEGRARGKAAYATSKGWMRTRADHLKRVFGLSLEDYERMHTQQDGLCAICKQPETVTRNGVVKYLSVDHCHSTGKIRGLLCVGCNAMLGHGRDNAKLLKAAIAYLER